MEKKSKSHMKINLIFCNTYGASGILEMTALPPLPALGNGGLAN